MIGNPRWFMRRKWGGWGVFPITWQGWAYTAAFVVAIFATQFIPADQSVRMIALGIIAVILVLDTIDIMIHLKRDERETLHEAIAERNAMWTMVFVLAAGIAYQSAKSVIEAGTVWVDPVIIIALVAALLVKAITNYRLR